MSEKKINHDDPLEFAALVAHQLKSPVSAAGSLLRVILNEYAGHLTARQKEILGRVDKRIEEAIDTVQRMLAIARPDVKTQTENPCTEVASLIHRTIHRFNEEAGSKKIALSAKLDCESAHVRMGEEALSEALSALMNNALKYTPHNGKIEISLSVKDDNKTLCIAVGDSGAGVPEDQWDRIFEPFYRSTVAEASTVPGVGLGLAFVKALMKASDGTVNIRKSHLGGAEFAICLPQIEIGSECAVSEISTENRLKVVIVGGVAAGPKVASKVIRLDPNAMVTIVEKGDLMSYAGCGLPYYVSGTVKEKNQLLSTPLGVVRDPVFFHNIKNVNVMNQSEAIEIDRKGKRVLVKNNIKGDTVWLSYDKLVLATGSRPVFPNIPGSHLKNIFTLHGVRDAEGVRSLMLARKAQDVVIVGGGLIGVEMTEALAIRGCRVTIIEERNQIMRRFDWEMARLLEQYMESQGLRIMTGTRVESFTGDEFVKQVVTSRGTIPADMVILGIGVRPQVDLAKECGLEIGETGAIKVDWHMRTSDPDIYAAGDCVQTVDILTNKPCYMPLGSTANKQGRVAAVNLCGGNEMFPGVLGTTACKVFEFSIIKAGYNEHEARRAGYDVITVLSASTDREHFMPDARVLMLKLVVDRTSRCLIGIQAVGPGEASKRIDVAVVAMSSGMTVDLLANLDLSYAPPFSLAMDNIITAANIARNKLDGIFESVTPARVYQWQQEKKDFVFIDLSSPQEHEECRIPGTQLIPLSTLRSRMNELPRDKDIVTLCRFSIRGYEAALTLKAAGFNNVYVMDGGVQMWPYEKIYGMK